MKLVRACNMSLFVSHFSTETERLYGKDAECPREWATWLSTSDVIPSDLLPHGTHDYLNHLPVSPFCDTQSGHTDNHIPSERCADVDVLPWSRGHIYTLPQGFMRLFWTKLDVLH